MIALKGQPVFLNVEFSELSLFSAHLEFCQFENFLKEFSFQQSSFGYSLSDVHVIGHSLGAHAAGEAGRRTSGTIGRITGRSKQ